MAALTTTHRTFDRVEAGRSLKFQADVASVDDLTRYAVQAVRLYRRSDYTANNDYKWIDYTIPVGDPSEVDRILDELWTQATGADPPLIDALWADADPNSHVTPRTLRFPRERESNARTTLTWELAHSWLQGQRPDLAGHAAFRTELRFFDKPDGPATAIAPLWHHLIAQIELDGDTYVISDGEIWKASSDYLEELNAVLASSLVIDPPHLPHFSLGEDEASFNARAATHGAHLLIDRSLLHLTGQTSIEAGDLLSEDGLLMHVKRRGRSSALSHVAAQALAAAQLLRSDADARGRLDQMLASLVPSPAGIEDMRRHCASFGGQTSATVQIVIVGDWRGKPEVGRLPLLTRLNLSGWLRQMPCSRQIALVGTSVGDYPTS